MTLRTKIWSPGETLRATSTRLGSCGDGFLLDGDSGVIVAAIEEIAEDGVAVGGQVGG